MSEDKLTVELIHELVERKDIELIKKIGGTEAFISQLYSNTKLGLTDSQVEVNRELYGPNLLERNKGKSLLQIMYIAIQDKTLILLFILSIVSLILALLPWLLGSVKEFDWYDSVAIMGTIIIIVVFCSYSDWSKEKKFQKLNRLQDSTKFVNIIRNNQTLKVSVSEIVVGDIILLEPGDLLPVDALVLNSNGLKLDESSVNGESDAVGKVRFENLNNKSKYDPILISSSKVLDGTGTAIVIAVGKNSFYGKLLMSLNTESQPTPLEERLDDLAEKIAKFGTLSAVFILVALIVLMFSFNFSLLKSKGGWEIGNKIVSCITNAVTVVVVAVPEGLPLAVLVALAYASNRMAKDKNLVKELSSCEIMGNATVICSDKTGTLTQNKMKVVKSLIQTNSFDTTTTSALKEDKKVNLDLLACSIVLNCSAFLKPDDELKNDSDSKFSGSKTECALLDLAYNLKDYSEIKNKYEKIRTWPFNSEIKMMSTLVINKILKDELELLYYVKGASEFVLSNCSKLLNMETELEMTKESKEEIESNIEEFAKQSLRTIGIGYNKFTISKKEYEEYQKLDPDNQNQYWNNYIKDLVWLGLFGIEDPLREGVIEAVKKCHTAGVKVKMVTGDNILTAKAISLKCGILEENPTIPNLSIKSDNADFPFVMEGKEFRSLNSIQMLSVLPHLRVLARSSPSDKMVLVTKLKEMNEIVAVTGDGTNDGPALKAANVGFSMGISGTEVAKEASSIVLMDDNFSSILKAIEWGRAINDGVRKFLQFQLTVNITAVLLTFVSSCYNAIYLENTYKDEKSSLSALTAIQLLWVNLIMDTLAALALATDPPNSDILLRKPIHRNAPLINLDMWKMIIIQSIFQLITSFVLFYIYTGVAERDTIVFNTFVLMQLFNEINCRRIDSKLNIFYNLHRNINFILIWFGCFALQVIIVEFGDKFFNTIHLNKDYWLLCIVISLISLPLAFLTRLIPNSIIPTFCIPKQRGKDIVIPNETDFHKNVQEQLSFKKTLRGKRYNGSLSTMAILPSMMATSVCIDTDLKNEKN